MRRSSALRAAPLRANRFVLIVVTALLAALTLSVAVGSPSRSLAVPGESTTAPCSAYGSPTWSSNRFVNNSTLTVFASGPKLIDEQLQQFSGAVPPGETAWSSLGICAVEDITPMAEFQLHVAGAGWVDQRPFTRIESGAQVTSCWNQPDTTVRCNP